MTECPLHIVRQETWELLTAADLAKRGSWPVSGGWLEQTMSCVQGVRQAWGMHAQWRAKLGLRGEE